MGALLDIDETPTEEETCDYYIRGQAKRDFRKGCDGGSNPYHEGELAYEVYNQEMTSLFEDEAISDLLSIPANH